MQLKVKSEINADTAWRRLLDFSIPTRRSGADAWWRSMWASILNGGLRVFALEIRLWSRHQSSSRVRDFGDVAHFRVIGNGVWIVRGSSEGILNVRSLPTNSAERPVVFRVLWIWQILDWLISCLHLPNSSVYSQWYGMPHILRHCCSSNHGPPHINFHLIYLSMYTRANGVSIDVCNSGMVTFLLYGQSGSGLNEKGED